MSDKRKQAVVTGGSKRVGRAICIELAQSDFDVILTYHSDPLNAEITRKECEKCGVRASVLKLDLGNMDSVTTLIAELQNKLARLDVLVHNAAVYKPTPWGSLEREQLSEHYMINAIGPVMLTQGLSDILRQSRGSVIFLGDIHVMSRPRCGYLAYSMSKAAVVEMVYVLSRELAPEIRVNAIAPGVIAWPDNTSPDEIKSYEKRIPLSRSGTPQDAARAIRFLATEGDYITGEILRVDGGRYLT